jgi:hypothetical protein
MGTRIARHAHQMSMCPDKSAPDVHRVSPSPENDHVAITPDRKVPMIAAGKT